MRTAKRTPPLSNFDEESKKSLPRGVWPVMLTPFADNGEIDWSGVEAITEWYIDNGAAGLFAVCLSSEMYEMTRNERRTLAECVIRHTARRVPVVVGGMIGGTLREKADWAREVCDLGAAAAVVIVNQLVYKDADEASWRAEMEQLLGLTESLPLGLYECPLPYHRVLSAETVSWCAQTNRFCFMKETSANMHLGTSKAVAAADTPLAIYNAHTPTLPDTLRAGGHGCSNIAANLYPQLFAWYCAHHKSERETADELSRFLTLADPAVRLGYPLAAKRWLAESGVPIRQTCRQHRAALRDDDIGAVHTALRHQVQMWNLRLGVD